MFHAGLMSTALTSAVVYAPGAFFFYPWKLPVQLAFGDTCA